MKRIYLLLAAILLGTTIGSAMTKSRVRREALYLTDKMGYELRLSDYQMDDVYEINYDFIYAVRDLMPSVLQGYEWAMDDYYDYLDVRNDDLRYVLDNAQYSQFLKTEDFYRPIYETGNSWGFRIYLRYTNRYLFEMSRPSVYYSYDGLHYRTHYNNVSFYASRYSHPIFGGSYLLRAHKPASVQGHAAQPGPDFQNVKMQAGSQARPSGIKTTRVSNDHRTSNGDVPRVSSQQNTNRQPAGNNGQQKPGNDKQMNNKNDQQAQSEQTQPTTTRSQQGTNTRQQGSTARQQNNNRRNDNDDIYNTSSSRSQQSTARQQGTTSSRQQSTTQQQSTTTTRQQSTSTSRSRSNSSPAASTRTNTSNNDRASMSRSNSSSSNQRSSSSSQRSGTSNQRGGSNQRR